MMEDLEMSVAIRTATSGLVQRGYSYLITNTKNNNNNEIPVLHLRKHLIQLLISILEACRITASILNERA